MPTTFDEIEDLALVTITDPSLDNLYRINKKAFTTLLDGFLLRAIPKFKNKAFQSLEYDLDNRTFVEDLDQDVVEILACLVEQEWLKKNIQDTTQMNLHLQGRAFKNHSEAQNLKGKQDLSILNAERVSQLITDYKLANLGKIPFYGGNK